jgi:hypothetical protein
MTKLSLRPGLAGATVHDNPRVVVQHDGDTMRIHVAHALSDEGPQGQIAVLEIGREEIDALGMEGRFAEVEAECTRLIERNATLEQEHDETKVFKADARTALTALLGRIG